VGVKSNGDVGGTRSAGGVAGGAGKLPSIYISSPVCNGATYKVPSTACLEGAGGGGGEGAEECERGRGATSGGGSQSSQPSQPSQPAECTRSAEGKLASECMHDPLRDPLECMVDKANKLVFWTENFEAYRDGHRWVWLDHQGYDVDGSGSSHTHGQGKASSGARTSRTSAAAREASKGPQKVTIPMSGLALGASHNVTVALVGTEGRVLVSDSLLFRLPAVVPGL